MKMFFSILTGNRAVATQIQGYHLRYSGHQDLTLLRLHPAGAHAT